MPKTFQPGTGPSSTRAAAPGPLASRTATAAKTHGSWNKSGRLRIETFERAPVPSRQIMPAPIPPSGYATRDKFSFSYLVDPPLIDAPAGETGFLDTEPVPSGSVTARRLALLPIPATPATWIPAFRKSLRFQP